MVRPSDDRVANVAGVQDAASELPAGRRVHLRVGAVELAEALLLQPLEVRRVLDHVRLEDGVDDRRADRRDHRLAHLGDL